MILAAAQAAFLPEPDKRRLERSLEAELFAPAD